MKNGKFLKSVLFAFLAIATLSCSDDDSNPPQSNTIAAIASRTPDLSTLVQALDRAGLVAAVDGTTQLTVFAPTNAAFDTFFAGLGSGVNVNNVDVDVLRQVLLNHVVSGSVQSSQLSTGYGLKTLATYNGGTDRNLNMYVNTTSGVRLNGVSSVDLERANIIASNGVIHVVDAVIGLPTVVTFAAADPNFSALAGALTAQGLVPTLNSSTTPAPFTVFAPTNNAFAALENDLPGVVDSLTSEQLTAVLTHHVIAGGNVRSSDLTPNGTTTAPSLQGQNLNITLPGTNGNIANITDGSGRTMGIVAVDVQAANGVIHVLNNVLVPDLN